MPPPNLYAAAPARPPLKRLFISFLPLFELIERKPFTSISFPKSAINVPVPRDFVPTVPLSHGVSHAGQAGTSGIIGIFK